MAYDGKEIREKLVLHGVAALGDAELISIVINEGTAAATALELARKALDACGGSLSNMERADLRQLRVAGGLGIKRAVCLKAALELGRRLGMEEPQAPQTIIGNEDVVRIFRPQIASLPHEEFWVLYLSSANTVIGKVKVSQGGVSGTVVDYRLIVKRAVELLASGIILVHNHPSGVALPSEDDKVLTARITDASSLFDIVVLDHLIITTGECFSFRGAGVIK